MQAKGQGDLAARLPKSIGFGIGLEFRESTHLLNAKNPSLVKPGMAFNVSLGTASLESFALLSCQGMSHSY